MWFFVRETTFPENLPDTIRSRCTLIAFRKAVPQEVISSLDKAVLGEKLDIEDQALEEIAKRVDGSFREAHKILEQLSFEKGKITKEKVLLLLAQAQVTPLDLLKALAKRDAKEALVEIDRIVQNGANLKNYTQEFLSLLRSILLVRVGIEQVAPTIEGLDKIEDIKKLIELFSQASISLSTTVIPQLPLELAAVKWCLPARATPRHLQTGLKKMKTDEKNSPEIEIKESGERKSPQSTPELQAPSAESPTLTPEQWRLIMSKVKESNYSAEALLRAARPHAFDGQTLKIEVFYAFHKERLEHETFRTLIEKAASEALATNGVKMICFLSSTKQRAVDIANITEEVDQDLGELAEKIFGSESGEVN